ISARSAASWDGRQRSALPKACRSCSTTSNTGATRPSGRSRGLTMPRETGSGSWATVETSSAPHIRGPMTVSQRVLVTGGAGYVGSNLVPKLLAAGHEVTVLDLYLYGGDFFAAHRGNQALREVKGDIRDPAAVARAVAGCQSVIHLACISNDPS